MKYCDNNDDIIGEYNNAFVTFKLDRPNTVELNGGIIHLKAMPDLDSYTLKNIDVRYSNQCEVQYVSITTDESWIKLNYEGKWGYVNGDSVKVSNNNDFLLKLMFSEKPFIDGFEYYAYWHNQPEFIQIIAENKTVDTSVDPIDRQESNKNNKGKLTISQSELGFLYSMTKEICDSYNFQNDGFMWLLTASLHESSLGMSTDAGIETWKSKEKVDAKIGATGYFQCTTDPVTQMAYNILTAKLMLSDDISIKYLETRDLAIKWSDLAIRLDHKSETVKGMSEYLTKDMVQAEEDVEMCSVNHYYGNIAIAGNILRIFLESNKDILSTQSSYDITYDFFKTYASKDKEHVQGFRPPEFISILDTLQIHFDKFYMEV